MFHSSFKRFLGEATTATQKRIWLKPDAEVLLHDYAWPGNVRQLRATIQQIVALGAPGPVSADVLRPLLSDPFADTDSDDSSGELSDVERRQILRVLREAGGNKTKAAEILGIQRRTLYKKARSDLNGKAAKDPRAILKGIWLSHLRQRDRCPGPYHPKPVLKRPPDERHLIEPTALMCLATGVPYQA